MITQWHEFRKRNNLKHLSETEKWRCFKIYEAEYYHARKILSPVPTPGSGLTEPVIPAPVINSELQVVVQPFPSLNYEETFVYYTITATNSPTSFSIDGLPEFFSFDSTTGEIYLTRGSEDHDPETDPDGFDIMNALPFEELCQIYTMTISATNDGGTDTATLEMLLDGNGNLALLLENLTEPLEWNTVLWYFNYFYSSSFTSDTTGTLRLYRFCTNDPDVVITQEAACTNLLNPAGAKVIPMNNCTWDYVNGFTGNGVDMYLDTQFIPSSPGSGAVTQNSMSVFVKVSNRTTNAHALFGSQTGVTRNFVLIQVSSTQIQLSANTSTITTATVLAGDNVDGDYIVTRRTPTGVNSHEFYINGIKKSPNNTSTSSTPPAESLAVLARKKDGAILAYSTETVRALKIGNSGLIRTMIM